MKGDVKIKITKGTIIRTAILVLALVNQVLTMFEISPIPIDNDTVTDLISIVWTVAASIAAWWKNNSFTKKAIAADKELNILKKES